MLGLLISKMEQREMVYLLKRELEEILMDMEDHRIDEIVKESMKDRYHTVFQLFKRVANEQECIQYMLKKTTY